MAFTNRVDTVTLDFLVPRVVDTVLRGNTFTTSMLAKTKKFRSSTMDFPIKYQKGISGTSFAGFDTLPTSASDTRVLMIYNPRFYANNVALPLTEIAANATVQKVMDLATVEMRSRAQDCADDIGTLLYGTGTGNSNKDFLGLAALVDDGTTVSTIGGLSRTTYPTLAGTVTASGGTLSLAKMRTLFNAIADATVVPTSSYTTYAVSALYESLLQPQERIMKGELIEAEAPAAFPDALILQERQNIFTRQQFRDGLFEVQDAGSQLIAPFLDPQPGMRVIDACAGAGGKTLHLAALMKDKGRIIAMDTEAFKLDELKKRARRAGASNNIETRVIDSSKVIKRLEDSADRVLLDVPCSGLGVLRRNPDAKWKLSTAFIDEVKVTQQQVLSQYSSMLKKGGLLVYSTCSILPSENEEQVKAFITSHPQFEMLEQKTLYPSEGFDGFYMARLKRLS
jgi:16S rRNA C967 or C1407 C5-methylase (RsmB/RsmF family)